MNRTYHLLEHFGVGGLTAVLLSGALNGLFTEETSNTQSLTLLLIGIGLSALWLFAISRIKRGDMSDAQREAEWRWGLRHFAIGLVVGGIAVNLESLTGWPPASWLGMTLGVGGYLLYFFFFLPAK